MTSEGFAVKYRFAALTIVVFSFFAAGFLFAQEGGAAPQDYSVQQSAAVENAAQENASLQNGQSAQVPGLLQSASAQNTQSSQKEEPPLSQPLVNEGETKPTVPSPQSSGSQAVSIPIPKRSSSSFFSLVDKTALEEAKNASPESFKRMASILHRSDGSYTEPEKVLFVLSGKIMKLVWPSVPVTWNTNFPVQANTYVAAVDSAERGIFDVNTGNSDFFGVLLPALIMFSGSSRSDYNELCGQSVATALDMQRNSVLANYMMGEILLRRDNPSLALQYLTAALDASPDTKEIAYAKAKACYQTKNYKMSLALCQKILAQSPQDVPTLELAAYTYQADGEFEQAENYVLRVLQLEPENMDFVLLRAQVLMNKGDYIKASSLLDVYARTSTTDRGYLLLRSKLQLKWNKNNSAASETLSKALKLYPDDKDVLLAAAQLASDANMLVGGKPALELAQGALRCNPDSTEAMTVCVAEMNKNGDYDNAYLMSSNLVKSYDAGRSVMYDHVDICLALERKDEAWKMASDLYALYPGEEAVQQTYLKVLVSTKRRQQAFAMIDSLMKTGSPKMKSFLYYQKSLLDTDPEQVLSDLRSSLTANPRNRDSLYRLYSIYYEKRDWRRAQYYLKQVVALNPSDTTALALNAELDNLLKK